MKPWDEAKNRSNRRNHGIGFETAVLVFEDPLAVTAEDYIDENGEMRYQTLGSIEGTLILVAHVHPECRRRGNTVAHRRTKDS